MKPKFPTKKGQSIKWFDNITFSLMLRETFRSGTKSSRTITRVGECSTNNHTTFLFGSFFQHRPTRYLIRSISKLGNNFWLVCTG